jgi:energy-coupling factor transporter ATP-binding protein EcfA2
MKVLIFGQSGAGKTTLCKNIANIMGDRVVHINADEMRKEANDWDFSEAGRWRQFRRMLNKANAVSDAGKIALVDFICPYKSAREQFEADITIFMGTVVKGKYQDTNAVFEWPEWNEYDFDIHEWDDEDPVDVCWYIGQKLWEDDMPTVQMLGRWQPWHEGHQALLDRCLEKAPQVNIMIRTMPWGDNNPYSVYEVSKNLKEKLAHLAGIVRIDIVPNIVNITYGRKVGYTIEQEHFEKEIEDISATKIRNNTTDLV